MDNPRTTLCLSGPFKSFTATPHEVACHVTTCACPAPWRPGPLRDSTEDRRIGLNMNYSITFTEISFSPETSITNNPNNSYDNWGYARIRQKKGGQSVSSGSKAANTI